MKLIKQLIIILSFMVIGQLLEWIIPLPVPSTIYAMILLLGALKLKLIRLSSIGQLGEFLVEHLSLFLITPTVALLTSWSQISDIILPVLILIAISKIAVLLISGWVTQYLNRKFYE